MALTKQEIFDKAVIGVLSQGGYAIIMNRKIQSTRCMLRTRTGKKCAFGQVIPDELYDRSMEEHSFLKVYSADFFSMYPEVAYLRKHANLLQKLQEWHDNAAYLAPSSKNKKQLEKHMFSSMNLERLCYIAKNHNISLKNVNEYIVSRGYTPIRPNS